MTSNKNPQSKQANYDFEGKPCKSCIAFVQGKCSGCSSTCSYCRSCDADCSACSVVCWRSHKLSPLLNDIASLSFENMTSQPPLDMPQFVPLIGRSRLDLSACSRELPMVGIRPKDLIYGGKLTSALAGKNINTLYKLPTGTKTLLVLSAPEVVLEKIWQDHYRTDLVRQCAKLGLGGVIVCCI